MCAIAHARHFRIEDSFMTVEYTARWGRIAAFAVAALFGAQVAAAQTPTTITGRVVSDVGQPLEGANVYISEMNISVGTNTEGRYTLSIPGTRVTGQTVQLRVRYIGHVPQARPVVLAAGASRTEDFTLKVDVTRISDVVVTGVAEGTERAKLPFTVAKVDASDLPAPSVDPLSQLAGRVPGANIKNTSGRPGAEAQVLLRAPTSIDGSGRGQEPLYIVDGIILTGGLPDLNPNDIQSVEVVKGAAAASLYGARAGNGVIQITTKSGKNLADNEINFSIRAEYGQSDIERQFGLAENHTYRMTPDGQRFCTSASCATTFDYAEEILRVNSTGTTVPAAPTVTPTPNGANASWSTFQYGKWPGQTFNAIDQVTDPGAFGQTDVQATGRFGSTSFFTSLGYLDQRGSFVGLNGYQRTSLRLNVDQSVGDDLTFGVKTFYSRSKSDGRGQEGGSFFDLTRMPRGVDLFTKDTVFHQYIIRPALDAENENPLYALVYQDRADISDRFLGGLNATYKPVDWFDVRADLSYDRSNTEFGQFNDKGFRTARSSGGVNDGRVYAEASLAQSLATSFTASLRHQFGSDLNTLLQARYLFERQDFNNHYGQGSKLLATNVDDLDNATATFLVGSGESSIRQIGYFLIGNIDYKDRYIVDALVRRDGASVFGPDNRWATFGRLALAWRPTQEPWFNVPGVDEMKLRYSVGSAGNRPSFAAQYEVIPFANGSFLASGKTAGNSRLGVEKVTEQEMGIDALLFGRLGLTATYSDVTTKDQILRVPLPAATGFQFQWRNAGTLEGNTVELSLDMPIVRRQDLTFSTRVQYDRSRATITELNAPDFQYGTGNQGLEVAFFAREGERLGTIYGTRWAKSCDDLPTGTDCSAFRVNDDGYLVWTDGMDPGSGAHWDGDTVAVVDGTWGTAGPIINGKAADWGVPIKANDKDGNTYVPLGNTLPDYRVAISPTFTYKKFAATALFDGAFGQVVYNQGRHWSYFENYSHDQDQAGKSDEQLKPAGYYGSAGLYDVLQPNSHFVEDASYMKLRELTFSYRIGRIGGAPGDWNVSVIGRNLKTWTDYSGFDPEVGITGGDVGSGVINAFDAYRFPNLRTVTLALQASF
jgi:TonB-linked SusC/RagA family outer membrane protein